MSVAVMLFKIGLHLKTFKKVPKEKKKSGFRLLCLLILISTVTKIKGKIKVVHLAFFKVKLFQPLFFSAEPILR